MDLTHVGCTVPPMQMQEEVGPSKKHWSQWLVDTTAPASVCDMSAADVYV